MYGPGPAAATGIGGFGLAAIMLSAGFSPLGAIFALVAVFTLISALFALKRALPFRR